MGNNLAGYNKEKLFEPLSKIINLSEAWEIDKKFIDEVLAQAKSAEVVSFDIFDTALTRVFNSPIDVFAEVERRLIDVYGKEAKGFALAREEGERLARQKKYEMNGAEEVDFSDIYREVKCFLPDFEGVDLAKEVELFVEKQILLAVPDILELTRRLADINKPYVFVSDMYHSSAFLSELLSNSGYEGWQKIYVSSECEATKATGNIWKKILEEKSVKILHLGDDLHSDVDKPKTYNIKTIPYRRVISDRRVGARLNPDLLPFSRLKRHLDLLDFSKLDFERNTSHFYYRFGQTVGGMVLSTFINWLSKRAKLHHIEHLYFCARDGYLMQRAWEISGMAQGTSISSSYFYISRAALNLLSGLNLSKDGKFDKEFLDFLSSSDGTMTIKEALKRVELLDLKELVDKAEQQFGSLDVVLTWPNQVPHFREFLKSNSNIIIPFLHKKYKSRYELAIEYFKQEGLFNEKRKAMVDMGWRGTMQASLNNLLKEGEGESNELIGFYYGLWSGAKGNRFMTGLMESYFANEFLPMHSQYEVWQGVAVLEQLHSAPHGTTKSYQRADDGSIKPVLADAISEEEQHELLTKWFQQGALDIVDELFNDNDLPIKLEDLDKDSAIAAIGSYVLSPSFYDLSEFSLLKHCATFDHRVHKPLIVKEMPENKDDLIIFNNHADWIMGDMLYWWKSNEDEGRRNLLRDFINSHLSFFDNRILRQFM